jgi:hypothetical protein
MTSRRQKTLQLAQAMCREGQLAGCQFWAFYDAKGELTPVVVPVEKDMPREIALFCLQTLAKRIGAVQAIAMFEAWTLIEERHAGETEAEHRQRSLAVMPRDSERRVECIYLIDLRRGQPPVSMLQIFDRDSNGRPVFDQKPQVMRGGLEGIWLAVLDDPPPLPAGPVGDALREVVDKMMIQVGLP